MYTQRERKEERKKEVEKKKIIHILLDCSEAQYVGHCDSEVKFSQGKEKDLQIQTI